MRKITAVIGSRKTRTRGRLFALAAACCLLPLPRAFAAFENPDTGARQSGLGDAYAAVGGDAHALFYNPAGLAYLSRKEFSSSYGKLFMGLDDKSDISSSQLLYGQPVSARGGIGFGWMETALTGLYKERTLSAGYGLLLKNNFAAGGVLKQLQITQNAPATSYNNFGAAAGRADPVFANGDSAGGISADLGVLYEPAGGYSLGLSLQNVNQPEISLTDSDRVPALLRLAGARRTTSLLLVSELRTQEFIRGVRDYQGALGAEKWLRTGKNSSFALRGSMATGSRDFSQFTLGLGYRVTGVQVDYSFVMPLGAISFGSTSGTHRLSLCARFGRAVPRSVSWTMGEFPAGAAPEGDPRRAEQAEETARQLQEQVKQLETELEKRKQAAAAAAPAAAPQEQPGKTGGEKPAAAPQAEPGYGKIAADTEKALEFFREGMRYYSGRQLEKAVQSFQKSLAADPANKGVKRSLERTLTELEQEKTSHGSATVDREIRYKTRKGDTLRSLAKAFYGSPDKWTLIRDANTEIRNWDVIAEGAVLVIPQIPEITVPAPEARP